MKRKRKTIKKDQLQLFTMCVPGIIILSLFAYLPMFGLILAFKKFKFNLGIFGSEWVGFKNFEFFFTSGTFTRLIRNTLGRIFSADFGMFYYLTNNSSLLYSTTDVIDTYVYRALRVTGDVGMSTAIGLCQSVVGFIVLLVANKIAKRISDGEGAVF